MRRFASGSMAASRQVISVFNNKKFIAVLVLVAGYFVYERLVATFIGEFASSEALPVEPYDLFLDDTELSDADSNTVGRGGIAISRIDVSALSWNTSPARDPFSPAVVDKSATVQQILMASQRARPTVSRRNPVVSAIVRSENHEYAVIDGTIRAAGERFAGFRLGAIRVQSVVLVDLEANSTREVMIRP